MQAFINRVAVGQAYFAEKLLDYEMSANVGNWQWAAGTGCDAVLYFREPEIQQKKFDEKSLHP
jgi:deoxyribodipyrimidine photo-lyase